LLLPMSCGLSREKEVKEKKLLGVFLCCVRYENMLLSGSSLSYCC